MTAQKPLLRSIGHAALTGSLLALAACTVGPNYVRPALDLPSSYKEESGWKPATPRDNDKRGNWWEVYGDPQLNDLEAQLRINNLTVAAAEAAYRQAQALTQEDRAAYSPLITANAAASRGNSSTAANSNTTSSHSLELNASWEPDLWGKVRREVEAGTANEQASAADIATALLSAQGALAADYFQLRTSDAEASMLDDTIKGYERSLKITQNELAAGTATLADVATAQTQLISTEASRLDLGVQRGQLEHAIAILLGKAPARFSLPVAPWQAALPPVPSTGLPSSLLERRPDIAAAERQVAAANAEIGVAKSAYYPALTLSAAAGLGGNGFGPWFDAPTRLWSLGAGLAQTLFAGGVQKAQTAAAVAAYDATVLSYKQTVLGDFQAVEDNLVALRILDQEAAVQADAVQWATKTEKLAENQYQAGTVSYLSVVTAQATLLGNETTAVTIRGRQFTAHVELIEALGGSPIAAP